MVYQERPVPPFPELSQRLVLKELAKRTVPILQATSRESNSLNQTSSELAAWTSVVCFKELLRDLSESTVEGWTMEHRSSYIVSASGILQVLESFLNRIGAAGRRSDDFVKHQLRDQADWNGMFEEYSFKVPAKLLLLRFYLKSTADPVEAGCVNSVF